MNSLLVPVDFSDATFRVVEESRKLALALGASVVLFHVTEPEPELVGFEPSPVVPLANSLPDPARDAERLRETLNFFAGSGLDVRSLNVQGDPIKKILEQAAEQNPNFVVLGSHGHGPIYNLLVGSVTAGVLKGATCPVVIVPAQKR